VDTGTEPVTLERRGSGPTVDGVRSVAVTGGASPADPAAPGAGPSVADDQALKDAFVAHRPELAGLARRALGSAHLAEDAVQETFARAWRSRHRFDASRGSLKTWLYAIERHLLVDMARSRQRQEIRDTKLENSSEPIVDHVENAIASWQVEEAVGQLTDAHRTVIVEMYFKGTTSQELAARLEVPEGTVRSRLFYALKALKLTLQEMGWES
jgi:RNA polymerase sigma-70 factor (ECF subfamily)